MKYVILMHILNVSFRQTMTTKTQNTAFNYAEMLKMRMNSTVKAVLKQIKHKITILQYKCSFFDREKIKSAKIVKTVNTNIENNDKKMITARKFFNKNIMLILNSIEIKIHMIKKTN